MPKAQCSVHKHRRTRTIQKIAVGPARACAEAVRTKGNKQFVKTQCSSSNVKIPHTNRSKSYAHISHQPSLTPVTLSVNPGRAKALYNFLCSGNEVFKFPADTRFLCRAKALYNFSSAAETRDLNSRQIRASYAAKFVRQLRAIWDSIQHTPCINRHIPSLGPYIETRIAFCVGKAENLTGRYR